jgi:hypothetical protein
VDVIKRLEQEKRHVNVASLAVNEESHNYYHSVRMKLGRGQLMAFKQIGEQLREGKS